MAFLFRFLACLFKHMARTRDAEPDTETEHFSNYPKPQTLNSMGIRKPCFCSNTPWTTPSKKASEDLLSALRLSGLGD